MSRKQRTERVYGPIKHGKRWRVVVQRADGTRERARERDGGPEGFETEQAANAFIEGFRRAADDRTIGAAVTEYLQHLSRYGNRNRPLRPSSVRTTQYRLLAFFQLPTMDRALSRLTPQYAARLYSDRVKSGVRADTHRGELSVASTFGTWCADRGWLARDPFADVRPEGQLSAGKPTLRVDDAALFLQRALEDRTPTGLACAMLLLMGLRASELADRVIGDLDEGGSVLCVPWSKTRAGVRRLVIPRLLRAPLSAVCAGRDRAESVFGMSRFALLHHVKRICREAGVPVVSPHGLRGTAATTAVELGAGMDTALLQRALGHELDSPITERHYLAPGATENARNARLENALDKLVTGWSRHPDSSDQRGESN